MEVGGERSSGRELGSVWTEILRISRFVKVKGWWAQGGGGLPAWRALAL